MALFSPPSERRTDSEPAAPRKATMRLHTAFLAGLLALSMAFSAAPARAQAPGTPLPPVKLEGLAQTGAKTYDDFMGRAVLLEFFAYW